MNYIRKIEDYEETRNCAVTLGKFDGLHKGHQKLIEKIQWYGETEGLATTVVAFDMSQRKAVSGEKRKVLMTSEEKKRHLSGKIDWLLEYPFTNELAHMEAEDFIREVLIKKLKAKRIVVGKDFHFGYQKRGDARLLAAFQKEYGYQVEILEKECWKEREISSTYIKEELLSGEMGSVRSMLGFPYELSGVVEYGAGLGRKMNMRTMNIYPKEEKILPPNGVYAVTCNIEGKIYFGIANLGTKPTVSSEKKIVLETHVFRFEKESYGKEIRVALHKFERPEKKFDSISDLQVQVQKDIRCAKEYFRLDNLRNDVLH